MNIIILKELVSKLEVQQNEYLKSYLTLKGTNDIALESIIVNFNKNEALILKAIETLKGV